jgi:N4-gp56 family major capsid protein
MREAYSVGTNVFYGGNAANRAALTTTTHKVDTAILQRVIRSLARNNGAMYTDLIDASDGYNTSPIRPAYLAITTPEVVFTLESLTGWVPVEKYASTGPVMDAEVGAYRNIRFLQTTQGKSLAGGGGTAVGDVKSTSTAADVHFIHVFAQDAVGTVPLSNLSFENIIHPKGSGGPSDPMNQVGTSAWKRTGTELILNDAFLARIEVTVGDVAP